MITAKEMQNKVKDYETNICLKNKSLINYIEQEIEKKAENGKSELRLSLTIHDLDYIFPNSFKISYTEFLIIKKSFRARGFNVNETYLFDHPNLVIDWQEK